MGGAKYEVCLSFAREQRPYVEEVARLLHASDVTVFYDNAEQSELWGDDLITRFDDLYRNESRFCVVFASAAYARRRWTRHELRSALARAFTDTGTYLLPVRFDDTPIPGLLDTTGYVDARATTPARLAEMIQAKLGRSSPPSISRAAIVVIAADSPALDFNEVLDAALARAEITAEPANRHRRARWAVQVVPTSVCPVSEVLAAFVPALLGVAEPHVAKGDRLRIAVHADRIHLGDWESDAVSTAVDTATAGAVHDLAVSENASVVAVTGEVFASIVAKGLRGAIPEAYRAVDIAGQRTVHARILGHPGGTSTTPRAEPPTSTTNVTFAGPVTAGQIFNGPISANHIGGVFYGGKHE